MKTLPIDDCSNFEIYAVSEKPVHILYVQVNGVGEEIVAKFNQIQLLGKISNLISTKIFSYKFRAVEYSRLSYVIKTGIDIDPTDGVVYAESFSKAYEYGGWPKIMLVLDSSHMQRTYREIPVDTPKDEIRRLQEIYPTILKSKDRSKFWLSRLPEDDKHIASHYESEYAWWIPGDPKEALGAILIFGHKSDQELSKINRIVVENSSDTQ